jgi:hypothetical protein
MVLAAVSLGIGAIETPRALADHECEVQGFAISCSDRLVTAPDECPYLHYHGNIQGAVPDRVPACGLGMVLKRPHTSGPVSVRPITATAGATTDYVVNVDRTPGSENITYAWSGATCGTERAEGNRYVWDHREAVVGITGGLGEAEIGRAGDCNHRADPTHGNPLVTVDITGQSFTARCTFQGAGAGTGPACTVNSSQPASAQQGPFASWLESAVLSKLQGGTHDVTSTPFRFADDVSSRPTIALPWTDVNVVGAFPVQFNSFPAPFNAPPGSLCDQNAGGTRFICGDSTGLATNVPYTLFISTHEASLAVDPLLDVNLSFPGRPGMVSGWAAVPPFVGDTWQGAAAVPQIVFDDGKPALKFSRLQGASFADGPCAGCVGILEGPNVGLFVPNILLAADGNLDGFQWSFAMHTHDGTFGECPSCRSTITAFPAVPRESSDLLPFDPARLLTFGSGPASGPGGTSILDGTDGEGGFPLLPVAGGAALIAAVGAGWYVLRRRGGGLVVEGVGGVAVAEPAAGPGTLGPAERDEDIIGALRQAQSAGTLFGPTATTVSPDFAWNQANAAEQRAQEAILSPFNTLLDGVNAAFAAYRQAVDKYRTAYAHALSGSTEMQGLLQTWAEAKEGAQKADLAFAVLTLAWSGASIGLRIARWATTARTTAAAGEAAVAGTEVAASTAARTSRREFGRQYTDFVTSGQEAAQMAKLASEAGVDLARWTERYGGNTEMAGEALVKLVARMRGWHGVPEQVAGVAGRLLVNGRSALAGNGAMAADDIAQLAQWAQRPGFWEWLGKSANWFEEVGWLSNHPDVIQYASLMWNADDIAFLKRLIWSGGDLNKLRQLLGPAQSAAVSSVYRTSELAVAAGMAGAGSALDQAAGRLHDPLMQVGDLSNFVDAFGITDRFAAGQGGFRAGLGELWELLTSPVTTIESFSFTNEAQQAYDQFLRNHGGDLQTMGSAMAGSMRALEDLQRALDILNPDDPRNPLGGGREQALRDALDGLQRAYDGASPEWRRAHADEMAERRRHIEEKLAYVRGVMDALQQLKQRLPQMTQWINDLRRDPQAGGLRSVTTFMNPEIAVRLMSNGLYLNGVAGAVASDALGLADADGAAPTPGAFEDLDAPLEPPPTDWDEVERRHQEMQSEFDRRSAEFDSQDPEAYERHWREQMRQVEGGGPSEGR